MTAVEAVELSHDDEVTSWREMIDGFDAKIAQLVRERIAISRRIQHARIMNGGTRVELTRERDIRDAYVSVLGPHGAELADVLLRLSRGEIRSGK